MRRTPGFTSRARRFPLFQRLQRRSGRKPRRERGHRTIGPYAQAVRTNGFLYVSGQVALNPKTGEMTGADIRQQTQRVLENLKGILEAAGSNLHHVVKTTVFLKVMNEFAAMNEVYGNYFTSAPPARSTVQVSRLPKDALVEIEVIAGL